MESQPQNPEFRIIPENFHPCIYNNNECKLCFQSLKEMPDEKHIF